ncbi:MAG: DNA topoisomerase IB [Chitinophagaceae bacterium]|nr:DNA topoisomerase IB [Chitinophagaceae bacterium]
MQPLPGINISKRHFKAAVNDPAQAAKAVSLTYVSNSEPGYTRHRRGKFFYYKDGNQKISDPGTIERIRKLVIPPAWEKVWICKKENGHLQATGTDKLGRKQYRYHANWNAIRNQTKFYRLYEFGTQLPKIREQLAQMLSLNGFPKEKILAAIVSLLEQTNIRIGNALYEKLYGSFGLTTMKNRHVAVEGSRISFSFKGKKGIQHNIRLTSRKLATIVKACKEIPGKELFEYIDEKDEVHKVDSGMVNEFIRSLSGSGFSAKDFRTWSGSVRALSAFQEIGNFENITDRNRKIPAVFDAVAQHLGNTRSVCKKYYVHPAIVSLYEEQKLDQYLDQLQQSSGKHGLSPHEEVLMAILSGQQ